MKKVLIIVAGLFGAALFATSCVETTESESVTALREAKVAHMQALADQERYKAIQDSIQAAIKNASSAAELEKLLAEYQYQLLYWQKKMQDKEQAMLEGANQHIAELYTDYKTALGDLNEMRLYLVTKTTEKAQLESDIISLDAYIAKETYRLEKNIAEYEAKIALWNQYDGIDKADLETESSTLTLESRTLFSDLMFTYDKVTQLSLGDVEDVLAPFSATVPGQGRYPDEPSAIAAINAVDTLCQEFNIDPLLNNKVTVTADDVEYLYYYNINSFYTYWAHKNVTEYSYLASDTLQARMDLEGIVTSAETSLGAPSTTGANAEPASGLYIDLEDYQTQLEAAQKADPKDEQLIKNLEDQIKLQEAKIDEAKKTLAEAEARLAMFDRNVKCFRGDALKAYQDAIEALKTNETIEAYNEAVRENNTLYTSYVEVYDRLHVVNTLLNSNPVDVEKKILNLQSKIAEAQRDIAELTNIAQTAAGYDDPRAAMDLLLANIDAEIALINEQIALLEQIVASAKAALEEALAGESTPAE